MPVRTRNVRAATLALWFASLAGCFPDGGTFEAPPCIECMRETVRWTVLGELDAGRTIEREVHACREYAVFVRPYGVSDASAVHDDTSRVAGRAVRGTACQAQNALGLAPTSQARFHQQPECPPRHALVRAALLSLTRLSTASRKFVSISSVSAAACGVARRDVAPRRLRRGALRATPDPRRSGHELTARCTQRSAASSVTVNQSPSPPDENEACAG